MALVSNQDRVKHYTHSPQIQHLHDTQKQLKQPL